MAETTLINGDRNLTRDRRQKILLVEHLPSLDHDGEANQAGGGVSDSKVVKIISSNYSRNNIYVFYFKELLPRVITRTKMTDTDVAVYCPTQPPEAAVLYPRWRR